MTEDEAKTKWCHKTFNVGAPANEGKLGGMPVSHPQRHGGFQRTCIGSACMAWRWVTVVTITSGIEMGGYCGLTEKP